MTAPSEPVFALVGGNTLYPSCEQMLCLRLLHRPIVVLNNNDGCVATRSKVSSATGLTMAWLLFKQQVLAKRPGMIALSSNDALSANMSKSVVEALLDFSPMSTSTVSISLFKAWKA